MMIQLKELLESQHSLENLVILGDLHEPCIRATRVHGVFDENNCLLTGFVTYHAFSFPSVAIPCQLSQEILVEILSFLKSLSFETFWVVSFNVNGQFRKLLSRFFKIIDVHHEQLMITTSESFSKAMEEVLARKHPREEMTDVTLIKAATSDLERINEFYQSIGTSIWHPLQLESDFYHYLIKHDQLIGCGGTHFETSFSAQLGNIHILEQYRRRGLGLKLVTAITREILSRKQMATLFVARDNVPAISLYEKIGFKLYKPVNIITCQDNSK